MADTEQKLAVTVHATCSGFSVDIALELAPARLPAALERLRGLGIEPQQPASTNGAKPKVQKVAPFYDADGTACCPVHKRELSEGQFGLYCSAKARPGETSDRKGYCGLRFE